MATNAVKDLENLYIELCKLCRANEHDKVLKTSNRILHHYPSEKAAFHCKIISLLLADKYEEAIKQINSSHMGKELIFEKAYSEYRLNRNSDALFTLKNVPKPPLPHLELEAQILFRDEQFEESFSKYRTVIKDCKDDYEDERLTNLAATVASLMLFYHTDNGPLKVPQNTYELKYNVACYHFGKADYEVGFKLLQEAEVLLRETYENDPDVTQQEVNNELAPLQVQMAYAHHKMGHIREANEINQSLIKNRPDDVMSLAVAANNIVCLNRDQNIFDSRKRIKMATAPAALCKLTSSQRHVILTNEALLFYYTNQADLCRNSALKLAQSVQDDLRPTLVFVSQLIKEKQVANAIAHMEEYYSNLKQNPSLSSKLLVKSCLCLAQLYLLQGSISKCCVILQSLPEEIVSTAGFSGSLYTLYLNLENRDAAEDCLHRCVNWYRQQWKKNLITESHFLQILTLSAKLFVRHGNAPSGVKYYEEALKMKPNDTGLLARVIHAYSHFDRKQAEKISQRLETKDTLTEADIDNLESAFLFGAKYVKRMGRATETDQLSPHASPKGVKVSPGIVKASTKNKKRKKILPKNYDPTVTPDPERWLPKQERSYFRSRRKDKRNILRGPQGQAGGSGELDASQHPSASPRPNAGVGAAANNNSPKPTNAALKQSGTAPMPSSGGSAPSKKVSGGKNKGGRRRGR